VRSLKLIAKIQKTYLRVEEQCCGLPQKLHSSTKRTALSNMLWHLTQETASFFFCTVCINKHCRNYTDASHCRNHTTIAARNVIEDQPHFRGRGRAGYLAARGELGSSPGWTEPAWGELDAEAEVLDPGSRSSRSGGEMDRGAREMRSDARAPAGSTGKAGRTRGRWRVRGTAGRTGGGPWRQAVEVPAAAEEP
jgi:hypothetical protein